MTRPSVHCLVYGHTGAFKTTFASTFPTPGYVCMFDAYGQEGAFLRRGDHVKATRTKLGVPVKRVFLKKNLLWEIHFYHDVDPDNPDAFSLFREEQRDFDAAVWKSWVVDSINEATDAAKFEQLKINPGMAPFRAMGPATDQISLYLKTRPKSYECNVVLITHIAQKFVSVPSMRRGEPARKIDKRIESALEDEEGNTIVLRGIVAPGRLGRDNGLIAQYPETYRAYIVTDAKGRGVARLQTNSSEQYVAKTALLNAPDGCDATYDAIFENYDNETKGE